MKLKKKAFMGIMLVIALMLTPTMMAFADSDEAQESEKLYMTGDVEIETPIKVVIEENSVDKRANNNVEDKYAFESALSEENPTTLFEENSKKVSAVLNNLNKRTVTIDRDTYQFLDDFTDSYLNVYLTKTMPDMDEYYDLSSEARKENERSVEAFIYKNAIIKSNKVETIDKTLNVTEVTPITDNVDEVLFYLQSTFHTDEGDESGGTWFLVHVAETVDGSKLLKAWIQSYEFEMMQNNIKNRYLSRGVEPERDVVAQDILKARSMEASEIKWKK